MNGQTNKPGFRETPAEVQDSLKIITGLKTNSTIRDLEEEEGELEEKTGTVVSINQDKINGDGWTIKDDKGNIYQCSCASNMYDLPDTEEHGGVLYPKDKIQVTFEVNPVLKLNTIKEIKSLGQNETKLDISKWKHEDAATTVIAKPKAAISISDSRISFNYDNTNKITADDKSINITGKETNIKTNKINIDAEVQINGMSFDEAIKLSGVEVEKGSEIHWTGGVSPTDASSFSLEQNNSTVQVTINAPTQNQIKLTSQERVIADIKDQKRFPRQTQQFPLLTSSDICRLKVYANGIVTALSSKDTEEMYEILSSHNWIAPRYDMRNIIAVKTVNICDYCEDVKTDNIYIDYCPVCNTWHTLSYVRDNIVCNKCRATFCASCGHHNGSVSSKNNLQNYYDVHIDIVTSYCDYCEDQMEENKTKVYVNFCPVCNTWHTLEVDTIFRNGLEIHQFYCNACGTYFCGNCGTQQSGYKMKSFNDYYIEYDTYIAYMHKLMYIKED